MPEARANTVEAGRLTLEQHSLLRDLEPEARRRIVGYAKSRSFKSGDTIFLKDAYLIAFPTSDPNRVLADYVNGVEITGGTGGFDGANGTLFAFGGVDLNLGQIILRYAGTVCFARVSPP